MYQYDEDQDNYCNITGISDEVIESIGSTVVEINFGTDTVHHKIQLVTNNFPISTDGTLDRDFFYTQM